MKPWIHIPENSDFTIYNIPFGIFSATNKKSRVGVAIGDHVLDLLEVHKLGVFDAFGFNVEVLESNYLNEFICLGKQITTRVREVIQEELCKSHSILKGNKSVLMLQNDVAMHVPVLVGDYTDFYSSIEHATNVGKMFRSAENALLPNWKYMPVGYHGRASSIIVSGKHIYRPKGQILLSHETQPVFQASSKVDFELELGYIIGKRTQMGETVNTKNAEDYIFGKVLFNDWSARDIQKWEYVPLGPFLGKSFASSISPWVVTLEALEPFKMDGPKQEPKVLPYLEFEGVKNYDINLEVTIQPKDSDESIVSESNFKYMYWNMSQQIAHHTSNGCNLCVGDIMASGTISGKDPNSYGSMLELSWAGQHPVKLASGEKRKFIEDYDTVIMRGHCDKNGIRIGFGEVKTQLLPVK